MPSIFQELQSDKRRKIQWEKESRKRVFCVLKKLKTILPNDNLSIFKGFFLPICLLGILSGVKTWKVILWNTDFYFFFFFVEVYYRHVNVCLVSHQHPVSFKTPWFSVVQISFPGYWEEPYRGKAWKAEGRCRKDRKDKSKIRHRKERKMG